MATAVKDPTVAAGEYLLAPIGHVVVDAGFNNRRALGNIDELSNSIQSVGVLQPLLVWKRVLSVQPDSRDNGKGFLHVIAGHRRLAAAQQVGLTHVPVIVVDQDEKARLESLLVENLHRLDLDPLEEAEGYRRLVGLGLKQKDIAAKVGRSEAHISKRLALTNLSPLTAKLLAAGTIPIESAIGLAKYSSEHQDRAIKHVEKSYGKLEDAAPYQLRNLGDRAREEAKKTERAKKKAELKRRLKDDGVTILSGQQSYHWGQPGQPWALGKPSENSYARQGKVDLTPKQHSEFDCHAAAVVGDMWTEPKVVYLCTNPTSHMDKDEAAKLKKKIAESKRDPYEERQRAEKAVRAELAEAQLSRQPAIQEQLKAFDRPTLLKLALEALVIGANKPELVEALGLEVSKGKNPWDAVVAYCNASEANLVRAAAAVAIRDGQGAIADLTLATACNFYFNRDDLPQALAVAEWFKQVGIQVTEPEVKALAKAEKK